jgi:hypothetical protein
MENQSFHEQMIASSFQETPFSKAILESLFIFIQETASGLTNTPPVGCE